MLLRRGGGSGPNQGQLVRLCSERAALGLHTESHRDEYRARLTTSALAKMTGRPKAEMTMPVVRKMASSLQALLAESVSSTTLLEMQYGIGERM